MISGFIIQEKVLNNNYQPYETKYSGSSKYTSWPLSYTIMKNDSSTDVSNKMQNHLESNLYHLGAELCTDVKLIKEYCHFCNALNIQYRILGISVAEISPTIIIPYDSLEFLGYDYCSLHCEYYSALFDDLFGNVPPPLIIFQEKLNKYGMFVHKDDIYEYIKSRKYCIESAYDLEPHGDFFVTKIFNYINTILCTGLQRQKTV